MKITSKGQVTIPQDIHERCQFLPHTEVEFREEGGRVYLDKTRNNNTRNSPLDKVRGAATVKLSTEEIMRLTRGDE